MATNLARRTDPDTSHQAAIQFVALGKHAKQSAEVLNTLRRINASRDVVVTSAELAAFMGVDRYVTARRLPDLAKKGLVEQCTKTTCTVNGTSAVTWKAI
jgi:Mn-dependent DtxR family transcriptional regulator